MGIFLTVLRAWTNTRSMRKGIRCQRKGDGPLHGIRGGIRATHPRSRPWCRLCLATSESVMRKDRNSWAGLTKPMRRAGGRQQEELTSRDSSPSTAVQRDDLPRDMGNRSTRAARAGGRAGGIRGPMQALDAGARVGAPWIGRGGREGEESIKTGSSGAGVAVEMWCRGCNGDAG